MGRSLNITLLILVSAICLSGCVLNIESDERVRGERWDNRDLAELQRGETSSNQVMRLLGEPGNRVTTSDGKEIWQYSYREVRQSEVGFIFLFHVDVGKENTHELNIEMDNGTVADFWTRRY